jgi:hypothetical protein
VFKSDSKPGSVKLKDMLSETMKDNGDRIKINDNGWQYRFRPWEIATFEIRF